VFTRPSPWLWTSLALVVLVVVAWVTFLVATTPITVVADGDEHTARTTAGDVAGALDAVGVALRPGDEVQPDRGTRIEDGATITVLRATTLDLLVDDPAAVLDLGDDRPTVRGVADTLGELLDAAAPEADDGLSLLPALQASDRIRVSPPVDTPLGGGGRLEVQLQVAIPVTINVDGEQRAVPTFASRVGQLLEEEGITLGEHDRVEPDRDIPLDAVRDVEVTRVEVVKVVDEVTLEHGVEHRETDELTEGEEEIVTSGEDGLRHDTYEVVLVEGEEESRERIDQEVIREPVGRVVQAGTAATDPDPESEPEPDPEPAPADGPEVHLTFDDGPNPTYTPQILDLLAAYDAEATFFMVGQQVADHPQIAERVSAAGHTIGNHTRSHARLTEVDEATFTHELLDTQGVIEDTVGGAPSCLRPPFGARDGSVNQTAADLGLRMAMWDVDPRDWERPGTDAIVDHVLREVGPGDVVLLHDGFRDRSQTVAALERILEQLSGQGYRFTAMPDC
jgi:peptidoglycan-N-acetylglucosamine deacetylase